MDSKRMISLEAFKIAHCPEENDDKDSYDGSASESEEDDEWLFSDNRKRKGKGKEPAKSRKKARSVPREEDWATSAKIEKLCEILEGVREKDPSEKVIVFSQVSQLNCCCTDISLLVFLISSNLLYSPETSNADGYMIPF